VSVHIRRGDYLKFPDIHPTVSLDYYIKAISDIKKRKDIKCVLVFSDDIQWCKTNFYADMIRYAEGLYDYEEMLLMSACTHNIIANSSFSWWGAYLNENPDKIVYAPKIWCGAKANHGWEDIYLPEMIIV